MSIDTKKTLQAFEILADKMGDEMEFLTKHVHEYVLLSGFLETHEKSINKAVESIAGRFDELLVQAFAGKLRHKIPALRMGIKLNDFDKKRAPMIAAKLIVNILVDNGTYVVDKRVESQTVNNVKKFHTRLYIKLGGSYTKDLLKGIEDRPGVVHQKDVHGWKLSAVEKAFLRKVGSVPFCVSDVCTKELLMKMYTLKKDWDYKVDKNGRPLQEDPIMFKKRFNGYADTIMDQVAPLGAFYLSGKYCGRDRVYYEAARLPGLRPHGKLIETLMIDSAVPYDLTDEDARILRHIIYVTLRGRVSVDEANRLFSLEDLLDAQAINPMEQDDEESMGEAVLLNKCYKALQDYQNGVPSKYMFGYDFTNSGLLMSGVSFRSERMMEAGNIAGGLDVVDSHTAFGAAYDLDLNRKGIKKVHMGLMHGSAIMSIAKTIREITGSNTTESDVNGYNEKAYGAPVTNITSIAEWGTKIVGNLQSSLRWTMPDKFSACSRAYLKGVPVQVYAASASHKDGYTSDVIVSDMPWVEDKNGFPMYGKDTMVGGVMYKVEQKRRGLFANITHSIDAYMLRHITEAVLASGRPILLKHDDFIAPPGAYHHILEAARVTFTELFQDNLYQQAIDEIAEHSPYDIEPLELVMGHAECTVWESDNFLMP